MRSELLHDFAPRLIAWHQHHGRNTLPWQVTDDAYRIWLSEIMLQQTRVETVMVYYLRFLERFPDIATLADAPEEAVMAQWAGLGYYSRARHLHAAARQIVATQSGNFPTTFDTILQLPGIGRTTAAAIAAFAYGLPGAILDGNVKRVLTRVFAIDGWPGEKLVEHRLWNLAEALLPDAGGIRAYTQGLMDLGATLCTRARPRCPVCPFGDACLAMKQGRQGELPQARPKRILPKRSTAMLILLHDAEILLEKRPAPGIWGGLWSFPEFPADADPAHAAATLGFNADEIRKQPALLHTFTHFQLHIQPWLLPVKRTLIAAEPERIWLPLVDSEGAALPSPVKQIIRALSNVA